MCACLVSWSERSERESIIIMETCYMWLYCTSFARPVGHSWPSFNIFVIIQLFYCCVTFLKSYGDVTMRTSYSLGVRLCDGPPVKLYTLLLILLFITLRYGLVRLGLVVRSPAGGLSNGPSCWVCRRRSLKSIRLDLVRSDWCWLLLEEDVLMKKGRGEMEIRADCWWERLCWLCAREEKKKTIE